jgi:hypothetical protein
MDMCIHQSREDQGIRERHHLTCIGRPVRTARHDLPTLNAKPSTPTACPCTELADDHSVQRNHDALSFQN